jgi:hypothetical protein
MAETWRGVQRKLGHIYCASENKLAFAVVRTYIFAIGFFDGFHWSYRRTLRRARLKGGIA